MPYCKHQPVWKRISRPASFSLISLTVSLLTVPSVEAFDYFEHRYIGNMAYEKARDQLVVERGSADAFIVDLDQACNQLLHDACVTKKGLYDSRIPIRFGDLAALAGDHAGTPENLNLALTPDAPSFGGMGDFWRSVYGTIYNWMAVKDRIEIHNTETEADRLRATRMQWISMCSWMHDRWLDDQKGKLPSIYPRLDECPNEFLRSEDLEIIQGLENNTMTPHHFPFGGSKGYSPSRLELAQFEELSEYADLASQNKNHFPQHSWKTYSDSHQTAINYAKYYSGELQPHGDELSLCNIHRTRECFLRAAILYEGFAQHFLHDSFSSGHIGTAYSLGDSWTSFETKQYLQHHHDTLNAIGLDVRTNALPTILGTGRGPEESQLTKTLKEQVKKGWTAFGDRYLLTRVASFHRFVVIYVATQSLLEVLQVAAKQHAANDCLMCTSSIFPTLRQVPVSKFNPSDPNFNPTDLASVKGLYRNDDPMKDPRVSPLYREGWKLLVTTGWATGQFKDGGGLFDFQNSKVLKPTTRKRDTGGVSTFELGYLRNASPYIPNYWGVGVLLAPGLGRTSYYPLSVGYWFPREQKKLFIGFRANVGVRVDDPFTEQNPYSRQAVRGELSMPFDLGFEVYPPVAVYFRMDLFSFNFRGVFPNDFSPYSTKVDSLFGNGAGTFSFGLRIDLAGIS